MYRAAFCHGLIAWRSDLYLRQNSECRGLFPNKQDTIAMIAMIA